MNNILRRYYLSQLGVTQWQPINADAAALEASTNSGFLVQGPFSATVYLFLTDAFSLLPSAEQQLLSNILRSCYLQRSEVLLLSERRDATPADSQYLSQQALDEQLQINSKLIWLLGGAGASHFFTAAALKNTSKLTNKLFSLSHHSVLVSQSTADLLARPRLKKSLYQQLSTIGHRE